MTAAPLFFYAPFWAMLAALAIGALAFAINKSRGVNRTFAALSIGIAVWQLLLLLCLTCANPFVYLRGASTVMAVLAGALMLAYDAAFFPQQRLAVRLRRMTPALAFTVFLGIAPWFSFAFALPTAALYQGYFGGLPLLLGLLLLRTFLSPRSAVASQRWELRDLAILTTAFFAAIVASGAADPRRLPSINTSSILLVAYFALAAWLLTTRRVHSLAQLWRKGLMELFRWFIPLAVAVPCFYLLRAWPPWVLTLAIVALVYAISHLLQDFLTSRHAAFLHPREERYRTQALTVANDRWNSDAITKEFKRILGSYFGAERIDLFVLQPDFPYRDMPAARRTLIEAASTQPWITRESIARSVCGEHRAALLDAFAAESATAVITAPCRAGRVVIIVGPLGGLRMPAWPEMGFASELALIYVAGIDRTQAVRQSLHAQQLALVGFLASQFRHQARNQLEAIRAALEMLDRGMEDAIDKDHRALLLREVDELISDFNVMLDLARPDYDSLKPIPVLFPDVVRDVIGALTPMARRAGVTLETNIDPEASEVLADRRLLKQALINLVRNAIQALASTPGPQVVIGTRPNGTRVEIDVADNGPGVPATIFDDIFTTFTTTKFTGTGLGLSICRNAVSMMGGTIDYVTPRGRSQAVFRISLPKPPSAAATSWPDYAPASRHFTEASAG